jgi:D-3-phosphoglycerate dehydrogenase
MELRANVVNALQLAADRGLHYAERHEPRSGHTDSVRVELETATETVTVEGAILFGRPRLIQVDNIPCEVALSGHMLFLKNRDIPGVVGWVGTVLAQNSINIANFSLGRPDKPTGDALAIVETDGQVPDAVVTKLHENIAVRVARTVEFKD